MEETTHKLAGSTCFTKIDGPSSYLCIVLDYESSLLTSFNTPWERLRFVCLPWGLACAQNIFQQMMDQILACCDGVIGITDGVVVHGKDDKKQDKHLHKFLRVAHEHWLFFNKDKSIRFLILLLNQFWKVLSETVLKLSSKLTSFYSQTWLLLLVCLGKTDRPGEAAMFGCKSLST